MAHLYRIKFLFEPHLNSTIHSINNAKVNLNKSLKKKKSEHKPGPPIVNCLSVLACMPKLSPDAGAAPAPSAAGCLGCGLVDCP